MDISTHYDQAIKTVPMAPHSDLFFLKVYFVFSETLVGGELFLGKKVFPPQLCSLYP